MNNQAAAKLPALLRPWERNIVSFRCRAKTKTLDVETKRPSREVRSQLARLLAIEIETAAENLRDSIKDNNQACEHRYRQAHHDARQEVEQIEQRLRFTERQISFIREVYSTDVR